jgi:transposase-like protein
MSHNERIDLALASLEQQLVPNYSKTAREFSVHRTILMRRHKEISMSREQATSEHRKCLTNVQEEALISVINKLFIRRLPPTTQIIKNLAEEIIGREVNKNWTAHFVHRYRDQLKSLYLHKIDSLRAKSKYGPLYRHFFDSVEFFFMFCNYINNNTDYFHSA